MKYKLDTKKFLSQLNWAHPDFGTVAKVLGEGEWFVTDEMLTKYPDWDLPHQK